VRAFKAEDRPSSEDDVLRTAVALLESRLPPGWSLQVEHYPSTSADRRTEAVLRIRSSEGHEAAIGVEAKVLVEPRDVAALRERLQSFDEQRGNPGMVVARYLGKSVRERLAEAGLSYADASGNVRVATRWPGLFISDRGAERDPWRGPGRPRESLKGEPAAKVVRALADHARPWKITELVKASGASTGSVYRVVELLEKEDLASRTADGEIVVRNWAALLRRWSEDYQFIGSNVVTRWIAPRGLPVFLDRMRQSSPNGYAVTGTVAAAAWAPYAPARSAMVYVTDAKRAAREWDLRASDRGVNVLLAEPAFSVVLARTWHELDGLTVAAPAQVAVDLMSGPGRSPAEAEELVEWMGRNEYSWRQ
jgi:hypothetical protein